MPGKPRTGKQVSFEPHGLTLCARQQIAQKRVELGLSQQKLAEQAGIHWRTLSQLETGNADVRFEMVARVCISLGIKDLTIS